MPKIGRQICVELGYPELSEIVAEHVVLKNFTADLYSQGIFGSQRDGLTMPTNGCRHDQVVSLDEPT